MTNYRTHLTPDLPDENVKACAIAVTEEAKAKGLLGKDAKVGQLDELTTITSSQRNFRYGKDAIVDIRIGLMQGGSSSQAYLNGDPSKSTPGLWKQSSKLRDIFRKCIRSPGV